jgi:tRNA pseudouridine55 synthase
MTPAIYLTHKPVGPTSFSLVQACIAEAAHAKAGRPGRARVCHGGTLDPFAHGLLLILVGPATRLFDHLHAIPKVYEATVRWGIETDNGDPLGNPTFTGDPTALTPAQLDEALASFVGWHDQVPPATSAKRIDGERAYVRAHRGETVVMPPTRVYLHEARWLAHDLPLHSRLRIVVRGGYYLRALARDLGRARGCGAHLTDLHRTAIGPWQDPGPGQRIAVHGRDLLPWAPSRELSDQELGDLRKGSTIPLGDVHPPQWTPLAGFPEPNPPIRAFHLGRLLFLLTPREGQLNTLSTLAPGL